MIGVYSPRLAIAGKRNLIASQLIDIPSNELKEYVKSYVKEHGQEIFDAYDLLKKFYRLIHSTIKSGEVVINEIWLSA